MKEFIIVIILSFVFPSIVFGGMGDVYYCETNKNIDIKNGKITTYENEKFKFKRNLKGLKFGSEGFLENVILPLKNFDTGSELFAYRNRDYSGASNLIIYYQEGNFNISYVTYGSVYSMTGTCSIF